jgi:hypothetical protein
MDLDERRAWLEAELEREVPDPVWRILVQRRHVAGNMDESDEVQLVETTLVMIEARRRDVPNFAARRPRSSLTTSLEISTDELRRSAFAECVAHVAADHPDIYAFREEVLADSFPLPYKRALRYVDEDGNVREDAPHAQRLRVLTNTLTETYCWRADDASWFVLTGHHTPPIALPTVERRITRPKGGPEIGTITLTVEPWLPAEKVLDMYKKAQHQMLGKKPHQVSRSRLHLLEFVETMCEGLSWRECMDRWNDYLPTLPTDEYKDPRNFSRAYRQVREVVLEPGYQPEQQDQEAARKDRRERIRRNITRMERFRRHMERIDREIERERRFIERQEARKGEEN